MRLIADRAILLNGGGSFALASTWDQKPLPSGLRNRTSCRDPAAGSIASFANATLQAKVGVLGGEAQGDVDMRLKTVLLNALRRVDRLSPHPRIYPFAMSRPEVAMFNAAVKDART